MPLSNLRQLENSQVELEGEIPASQFETYYVPALKELNGQTKLKGFRPGHVPEAVLVAELGNEKLLTTMAELALRSEYPLLLKQHRIDALGQPQITITKLARHNPLGYKIVTAVVPQFSLSDYKSIATNINKIPLPPVVIEDKELETLLTNIKNHPQTAERSPEQLKEEATKYLQFDKERRQKDKRRLEIIEAIDKEIQLILPPVLIETELNKMIAELGSDLKTAGLEFEAYLKEIKKTAAELRTELRPQSIKRVRIGLILDRLAEAEHLEPDPEKIKTETDRLLATHPDFNPETIKSYIRSVLKNEVVWAWLESQK